MAFLDEMDRKLSQLGRGAIQKTKEVSETVRLANAIHEEEARQAEWLRQIGSYYFTHLAAEAQGELRELCEQIRQSQERVIGYRESQDRYKRMVRCPVCQAEVATGSAFCNSCGASLAAPSSGQQDFGRNLPAGKSCRQCGAELQEGQLFCTNCGCKVAEVSGREAEGGSQLPVQEPEKIEAEGGGQEAPEIPEPQEPREMKSCPQCHTAVKEGQVFCVKCGAAL